MIGLIFQPPEPTEEDEARSRSVSPRYVVKSPTPWVSLGSEPEIADENVINQRERVSALLYCYDLLECRFGKLCSYG